MWNEILEEVLEQAKISKKRRSAIEQRFEECVSKLSFVSLDAGFAKRQQEIRKEYTDTDRVVMLELHQKDVRKKIRKVANRMVEQIVWDSKHRIDNSTGLPDAYTVLSVALGSRKSRNRILAISDAEHPTQCWEDAFARDRES